MHRITTLLIGVATAAAIDSACPGEAVEAFFDGPSLDRWMYPFNQTPGYRVTGSTFGAFLFDPPTFDNRDGQVLVAYDTGTQVESGLGEAAYSITAATLVMQHDKDRVFIYDPTFDSYTAFLDPNHEDFVEDADPGQPLELYGTGYRGGFDTFTFTEDGPFGFGDPTSPGIRNAFSLGFDDLDEAVDVSNSVREEWDPMPWALGTIDGLDPGEPVPQDSEVVFEINVADVNVQGYFQTALNVGKLDLCLSSHTFVDPYGESPSYYLRENPLVIDGIVNAGQLTLTVEINSEPPCPADVNDDGVVDIDDLFAVLGGWGTCDGCPEDVNDDDLVNIDDVFEVLGAWGDCP